jgi:hypothetical protein
VLEHCRATRAPLGETLVAWGAVHEADLRDALRAQVADALGSLARAADARTLFLRRGASANTYDPRFTFALHEVASSDDDDPWAATRARLTSMRAALPDLVWAAELGRAGSHPHVWPARGLEPVCRRALEGGADFVALRTSDALVVGAALADASGSLWCGLPAAASLGTAVTAVSEQLARSIAMPIASAARAHTEPTLRAGTPSTAFTSLARDTLERFDEVWAIATVDPPTCCLVTRSGTSRAEAAYVIEHHEWLLRTGDGNEPRTVALGLGESWWLGGRSNTAGVHTWIALARSAAQGVGWALLTTLTRQLPAAACGGAR